MTQGSSETASDALTFEPTSAEFQRDPHAYYRRLREVAPVYRNPHGGWLLSRYVDCAAALEDARLRNVENIRCYPDGAVASGTSGDPAYTDFARIRKAVARALAPQVVRRFRPRVQQIVDDLLDAALEAKEVDLVDAFCHPLAAIVFCEIFGIPPSDRRVFREWVDAVARGVDNLIAVSPEVAERRDRAMAEFSDYFRGLIAARRRRPADDLLGSLISIGQDGALLTEDELISSCVILLITGHESTLNFISNATYALLRHPGELRRLRDNPSIGPSAIEELMRYEAPAQLVVRAARTELELRDQRIQEGELLVLLLGSANRDPAVFSEPERLDLTRRPNPHIAFGNGVHYCLGASLARMEGQTALATLLRQAPELALCGEPVYKPTIGLRGLASLPVRLR